MMAEAEPGLLPRLLAPFARRDLVPDRVRSRREGASLVVEIGMDAMPSEMLHVVEGNLRQVIGVVRLAVVLCAVPQRKAA
jgi:hypothetical protein